MTAPEPWVWLARIRRPQGRKGEVLADLLTDFPERFSERKHLWLIPERQIPKNRIPERPILENGPASPREVELIDHWPHKGGLVLHFAGVDSIAAAELLAGLVVAIPRGQRAPLGEGEVYISDLIGCTLVDMAGGTPVRVGEIEGVDRGAGPAVLVVVRGAGGEILIPYAQSYLRRIDLEARCVEMALPEGLIDLNEPERR